MDRTSLVFFTETFEIKFRPKNPFEHRKNIAGEEKCNNIQIEKQYQHHQPINYIRQNIKQKKNDHEVNLIKNVPHIV
jgi:hypothetical protein